MEPNATFVRGADGRERVVLELADFLALLDAAEAAQHGLPEAAELVKKLRSVLGETPRDTVDLDEFLAEYDAVHGKG